MKSSIKAAILGSADGVTSISGIIAAGAASGTPHAILGITALGGALASTVSMAGAEMISEDKTDWNAIFAMGIGTIAGAGSPAIPLLLLSGFLAILIVILVSITIALIVSEIRHRNCGISRKKAMLGTFAILALGALVGLGMGLLFG